MEAENDGPVGEKMTDEERKNLCERLRKNGYDMDAEQQAADEIERLAALAQSDAILRRCERWLRHEVEATFQEEGGYDLWKAVKTALAQSDAEPPHHAASRDYWRRSRAADAQSDAGPVAWQDTDLAGINITGLEAPPRPDASAGMSWAGFNVYGDKKSIDAVRDALHAKDRCEALDKMISEKQLVRPDASAGLIEAAEYLEKKSGQYGGADWHIVIRNGLRIAVKHLRARAADRNAK
jgi:hypothetical protein